MKTTPTFLSVEHLLLIHLRMIREFGGAIEIRDRGLLESAVMMPSAQFDGEFLHDSVAAMGAAYLFHLCKNHPFVDGNKRTALATAEMFVLLNGWELRATNQQLEELTIGVAAGDHSKEHVLNFFRDHVKPA